MEENLKGTKKGVIKKKQILEGCFRLFLKKNINSITIDDLEQSTGVSRGNIFHYFKDKEEIFHVTFEFYFEKITEYFSSFFQKETTTLLQFIRDYVDNWSIFDDTIKEVSRDNVGSIINFFLLASYSYSGFEVQMKRFSEQEHACWKKVIESAIERKEIREVDVEVMVDRFQCIYMGVVLQSYLLPYSKKMGVLFTHLISLYEDIRLKNVSPKSIF